MHNVVKHLLTLASCMSHCKATTEMVGEHTPTDLCQTNATGSQAAEAAADSMLRQALQRSAALHAQRLAGGQLPCLQRLLGLDAAGTSGAAATCEPRYPQQQRQQQQRWGARHYSGEADQDDEDDDLAFRCSDRVKGIADGICELTLLEIHDLTELLKKKLGVTMPYGGMPMMGMPGMVPGAAAAAPAAEATAPEEEKTDFDIKLDGFDATSKIKVRR